MPDAGRNIVDAASVACIQYIGIVAAVLDNAHLAQSVEHLLGKEEVVGSIPIVSTTFKSGLRSRN